MRLSTLALSLALSLPFAAPAAAHELWIEPLAWTVPLDGKLSAHLVNGERFEGVKLVWLPGRSARSEVIAGHDGARPARAIDGRMGDRPALAADPLGEGLHILLYQSRPATVTYDDLAAFARFAEHKDFPGAVARHRAAGDPRAGFKEAYSRFSKALVAVGDGAGEDRRTGLETEFVALDNPYTADLSGGIRVQLLHDDAPRAHARIELFDKAPDGTVQVTYHRTDAAGIAALPVRPGHSYLADAVILRRPDPGLAARTGAVWETLWAALTFAVPAG